MSIISNTIKGPRWYSPRNVSTEELVEESGPAGSAMDARHEWLRSWIAIGVVVVIVVIFFLINIGNSLVRIDASLKHVDSNLKLVGTDVNPLPEYIQGINTKLGGINTALQSIPGQVNTAEGSLTSIDGHLGTINGNLDTVNSNLGSTESSLNSTETSLGGSVLPDLNAIEASLHDVQVTAPSVNERLSGIDQTLASARGDTSNIENLLRSTNSSLAAINQDPQKLGLVPGVFTTN